MDSVLEEMRALHEQRDVIEMEIADEMLLKKNGHKDRLDSEHRQKLALDKYMKLSKNLLSFYEQINESPLVSKNDNNGDMTDIFNEFHLALRRIKEVSNDQPNDLSVFVNVPSAEPAEITDPEAEAPVIEIDPKPAVNVEFTDEEGYGRYLDLTQCHEAFLQVIRKEEVKPNYLTFLEKFDHFSDIDRELKLTSAYKNYVNSMLEYFQDYSRRAKPLFDYQSFEAKIHEDFLVKWNDKTYPGWFTESDRTAISEPMIDLKAYKSHEQLMEMGLECLKSELQARGLKCGGTLEDRAKRLWAVRGVEPDQIDDSLRAAPIASKKGKKKTTIEPFTIAAIEAKLTMYAEYYNDHRIATIENVQRKQARTAEERNESDDDISDVDDDEDEDQNDVIYNPKNLPLGWDDKPIPYWLYKLHGLNLTFTCEICGNATYKGPKTFQRHFAEWRHAHGMRCLGIPNTAHFANITKIQDAISLWDKLKSERQKDSFQPQNEEEFEDSQGNVVNKKTFEDLKRQGLL